MLASHSFPLVGDASGQPLSTITPFTLGTHAVIVFFALSGFFIAASFDRKKSMVDFATARALRLFPALFVATTVTALAIGPFFTDLSISTYLLHPETFIYPFANTSLIWHIPTLPGVFHANPVPVANGSIWTLPYEAACYVGVAIAGAFGLLRPRLLAPLTIMGVAVLIAGKWLAIPIFASKTISLVLPFAFGAALYVFRDKVPLSLPVAAFLIAGTALTSHLPVYREIYIIALSYSAFWLGSLQWKPLLAYNKLGDYSYGVYIYAWPVQECLVAIDDAMTPFKLMASAMVISMAAAICSWHFLERPVLALRHNVSERVTTGLLALGLVGKG